jgi:Uma2 family endonuclease
MRHELIRGELRSMSPVGGRHGKITLKVGGSLLAHVEAHELGTAGVGDVGFVLAVDPDTVRAPDVCFIRRERVPETGEPTGYWTIPPDLAVEVLSPNDRSADVNKKVTEWLEFGARLVFVIDPGPRTVAVHRPHAPVRVLTEDDTLDGEDIVPGWSLPVRALFA